MQQFVDSLDELAELCSVLFHLIVEKKKRDFDVVSADLLDLKKNEALSR